MTMTEKRKRGPIKCKPGSKEAKRIEDTHGFGAALKAREKRRAEAEEARNPTKSAAAKGDKA